MVEDGTRRSPASDSSPALGSRPSGPPEVELERARAAVKHALGVDDAPAKLGRFVLLHPLGEGGMGRVYLAHDPTLDRKVALKILQAGSRDPSTAAERRRRIMREAKALAQLDHDNVLRIFDVGVVDTEVFIAEQYVPGQTLAQWQEGRAADEILEAYRAAGRGLAAAHAAGILHCDFKPANVIVAKESDAHLPLAARVFVLDFGLAKSIREVETPTSRRTAVPQEVTETGPLGTLVSEDGMVMGTPAYMAPEQHFGQRLDPRTDQYAFCVCLYEALVGTRPFSGTYAELAERKHAGAIPPPPEDSRVDPRVLRAIVRGLAPDPEDRWASMNAVLTELAARNDRTARSMWIGVGAVALILGSLALLPPRGSDACGDPEPRLAGTWDDARRVEAQRAILTTGVAHAPETWARLEPRLDAYATGWRDAYRRTCDDAGPLFDLRMACLDDRLRRLVSLVDLLDRADATVVAHAVETTLALPSPASCLEPDRLTQSVEPPPAASLRAVNEIRDGIARLSTQHRAGRYDEGLEAAMALREQAQATGYAPVEAESELWVGIYRSTLGGYDDAEAALTNAYWVATAAGHDEVATRAATKLVALYGGTLARPADAHHWVRQARASLARLGGDNGDEAELDMAEGTVFVGEGRYDDAQVAFERALAQREEPSIDWASTIANLGLVAQNQGRHTEAEGLFRRAREAYQEILGPRHPEVAELTGNIGSSLANQGRFAEAVTLFEETHEIEQETLPPDHAGHVTTLSNLGASLMLLGRLEEAKPHQLRALAIAKQALGEDHPTVAALELNLGLLSSELDDVAGARLHYDKALKIYERSVGPDHPDLGRVLNNLGSLELEDGRPEDARALYQRAVRLFENAGNPDSADLVIPLTGLGRAHNATEDWAAALPLLERALKIGEAHAVDDTLLAETRFALAIALRGSGPLSDRSRALAEDARAALAEVDPPAAAEIEAWLRR